MGDLNDEDIDRQLAAIDRKLHGIAIAGLISAAVGVLAVAIFEILARI